MNNIRITTVKILLFFSISLFAQEPVYVSGFMGKKPILDGKIDTDQAWTEQPWTEGFVTYKKCSLAKRKTRFKIGYTDAALYFAIDCEEPEMNKISVKRKDLGALWRDDNIEIFLLIDKCRYRHFVINAAGARTNILCVMGGKEGNKALWEWRAKAKNTPRGWTAEIVIPVSLLNTSLISPKMKSQLKFNIGRTATPINEISSWMPQKVSFHDTDNFAILHFAGKLSKQQIIALKKNKEKEFILKKIAEEKLKWQQFETNFSKGDRKNDETFAALNKAKIRKINLLFKDNNLSEKQRYQNIVSLFKNIEQEARIFNYKLEEQFIKQLTNK